MIIYSGLDGWAATATSVEIRARSPRKPRALPPHFRPSVPGGTKDGNREQARGGVTTTTHHRTI